MVFDVGSALATNPGVHSNRTALNTDGTTGRSNLAAGRIEARRGVRLIDFGLLRLNADTRCQPLGLSLQMG
ncbi:hypothetical protein MBOU_22330 [Mycobacterium bourgelatii]|uniref:Uncharacterized protein n=1 Tax=Mycobacterium bourgelatii TaxID=1273442 RepID=A0A7I9YND6_MYCBU|nr:hypothetical protein MBOU_22330 [Mycobacterium bourgelatii]